MPTCRVTHYQTLLHRDNDPMPKVRDIITIKSPSGNSRVLQLNTSPEFMPIFEKTFDVHNNSVDMEFTIEEMKIIKKYSKPCEA